MQSLIRAGGALSHAGALSQANTKKSGSLGKDPRRGKIFREGGPRMMGGWGGVWRETFAFFLGAAETFSRVPYDFLVKIS